MTSSILHYLLFFSMDEEAQKRNTDCVYFLASPLTCKKGNGCEFRHSEAARMNPQDCWYWVHRTCLNPSCAFRHLPLDVKPSLPAPPQTKSIAEAQAVAMEPTSTATSSKSKTPCYFFTQGNCAKGDKCSFMHSASGPTSQDVSIHQKSMSHPGDVEQANSKPVVVHKAPAEKHTSIKASEKRSVVKDERNSVPLRSLVVPVQEAPQMVQDVRKARVPDGSVSMQEAPQSLKNVRRAKIPEKLATSVPSVHEEVMHGSSKPRITKFFDMPEDFQDAIVGRFHDKHSLVEMHRTERKQQQVSHCESKHLQRNCALDRRHRISPRSEAQWKNEFSGLEGDESGQSNHKEHGEYSPHLERSGGLDDSRHQRFKFSNRFDQGGPSQHRDYGNRNLMHSLPEYPGSIQHPRGVSFASRAGKSVRDGRRMVANGHSPNIDLCDQLMKHRRDERSLLVRIESVSRRRGRSPHLSQRLSDGNLMHHTQHGRARRAEVRGVKRPFHDGEMSPNGLSACISPGRRRRRLERGPDRAVTHDRSRNELRDTRREHYDLTSDVRSCIIPKKVGSEHAKDEVGFTGPKSLAQIKAEKMAALDLSSMFGRSQVSIAPVKREAGAFDYQSALSRDFEGPKPLGLLKKVDLVSQAGEKVGEDMQREVEDGEVRDEEDDWNQVQFHDRDLPVVPMLEEEVASRLPSDQRKGLPCEEAYSFREANEAQDEDLGSSEDISRVEEDLGPVWSGEEDYELDDVDEENFAKNLNGYFSS